ncbi:hypothetical protein MD484_g1271, partial [Candolleomyces efflorescens]
MKSANSELDHGLTSIGTDLGTMGLDMSYPGVQPPPPSPSKAALFSDETLFFMFYSSPRDAIQEVAAQELWNRNWRWHKDLRLWITKESGTAPSQKVQGGEQGLYTFWDPETWQKERKDMTVVYADLEEKSTPANTGLMPTPIGQTPGPTQQHAQPAPLGAQLPNQVATAQRGSFQMGVAA